MHFSAQLHIFASFLSLPRLFQLHTAYTLSVRHLRESSSRLLRQLTKMRFSPAAVLLALPALTVADSQLPLFEQAQEWFASATEQVKGYLPSGVPGAVVSPIDAGASYVAGKNVEKFNINNFQRKLAPSQDGPTEWLIFVTGKNESCWGGCESANLAWNVSKRAGCISSFTT